MQYNENARLPCEGARTYSLVIVSSRFSSTRDDLAAYVKLAGQNNAAQNQEIQHHLMHWRNDPDLASVRDSQVLDHLPDNERAVWQARRANPIRGGRPYGVARGEKIKPKKSVARGNMGASHSTV